MQNSKTRNTLCSASVFALIIGSFIAAPATAQDSSEATAPSQSVFSVDLPAQPLIDSISALSLQTNHTIATKPKQTEGVNASALKGRYTVQSALDELLSNTGLNVTRTGERAFLISSALVYNQPQDRRAANGNQLVRIAAQNEFDSTTGSPNGSENETPESDIIIVTGTNIRGVVPAGSPILSFDRESIDQTGFATTQDFIGSLPQNFTGSVGEIVQISDDSSLNISRGTGINLRGLGNSATLTLVNGKRMAQGGGASASFVDISSIPLSAIGRIDVLTDGASATYGSDAVAGVVNIILRDDFEGAETRLRYGAVTDGNLEEIRASQVIGTNWDTGNILVSYEFYDRSRLGYDENNFTASSDLTGLGGDDFRRDTSNPGNIIFPAAAAIPPGQDGTSLTPADLLVGQTNLSNQNRERDLLPEQQRHSAILLARQSVSDFAEVYSEFFFSRRTTEERLGGQDLGFTLVPSNNPFFATPVSGFPFVFVNYNGLEDFGSQLSETDVTNYAATLGANIDIIRDWNVEVFGRFVREEVQNERQAVNLGNLAEALGSDNPSTGFDPNIDGFFNIFGDGSNTPQNVLDFVGNGFRTFDLEAELWIGSAVANGTIVDLPGGEVQAAIGLEYRNEALRRSAATLTGPELVPVGASDVDLSRDIFAGFAEIQIPLIGDGNALPGINELTVNLSGRIEDYSDFGSTANPKIGAAWVPLDGLSFRASYGTSFRAPNLSQLSPNSQTFLSLNAVDPSSSDGTTLALFLQGANPTLGPEEAETWSVGLDMQPKWLPGLSVSATYYSISYTDRVGRLTGIFGAFLQPELFAPIITRSPDENVVQEILDSEFFLPSFGVPPASDVEAIVDARDRNLSSSDINGLDFLLNYNTETDIGEFIITLNGNYVFSFDEAVTETAPVFDVIDTLGNPLDLRIRGGGTWSNNGLNLSMFVNHAGSYDDNGSSPQRRIGSFTTVDLNLQYDFASLSDSPLLNGVSANVSVQNLFDQDPPFVNNPLGVGFDPANANPIGRMIGIEISKRW